LQLADDDSTNTSSLEKEGERRKSFGSCGTLNGKGTLVCARSGSSFMCFWLGLYGEEKLRVAEACPGASPLQNPRYT